MDELCIDIAVRQRKCQNNISQSLDNIHTNVEENSAILLSFGYILNVLSKNTNSVQISLKNDTLLNPIKFNIPYNTYKTFDLPLYNGTYVILIGAVKNNCECPRLLR